MRHHAATFLGLLIAVLAHPLPRVCAQEAPTTPPPVLGDEAYQLLTSFYGYDRGIPLEARVVEKTDLPNSTGEKIVYRVKDSLVVAYLGIPKTGSPPYPCVLQLHGLGGDKSAWWEDDSYISGGRVTEALLSAGIAVLAPDAHYHGERISGNDFLSPTEMIVQKHWWIRGRDMQVQTVVESRRAIDYLETRPEIDAARLGVIGYSLGGMETFALTALDSRIKVAVACATPQFPVMDRATDPRTFAHAVGDRPFLMITGRSDPFCAVDSAKRLYDHIPGSKKELVFFDSDHRLPVEYASKAAAWIQRELKPDANDDESKAPRGESDDSR